MVWTVILCLAIGYALGNIQSGILLSRVLGKDIRKEGSHNPGTTNMLRTYGKAAGAVTLLVDFGKAVLAVLIGRWIAGGENEMLNLYCSMAGGLGVILGHNWPALFGFKGGKGVACTAAVVCLIFPGAGGMAGLIWFIVVGFSRYVSLASIVFGASYAINVIFMQAFRADIPALPGIPFSLIICALIILRHRENMKRLWQGNERMLSFKRKK